MVVKLLLDKTQAIMEASLFVPLLFWDHSSVWPWPNIWKKIYFAQFLNFFEKTWKSAPCFSIMTPSWFKDFIFSPDL